MALRCIFGHKWHPVEDLVISSNCDVHLHHLDGTVEIKKNKGLQRIKPYICKKCYKVDWKYKESVVA